MEHQASGRSPVRGRAARALHAVRAALGIDTFRFSDKVVLVTGGSRGLGLVLSRRLARQGARLAIIARDELELARAKQDLQKHGGEVLTLRCDVREPAQITQAVAAITEQLGPIEVLIHNAGEMLVGPLELMTAEDFRDAMQTHFWGPLHATMAVLPGMRERGRGRIVHIASLGGKLAVPHMLPYCASKFALTGLSQGLRAELLRHGITVTTVTPGPMRTGSPVNASFKGRHRAEYAWFILADSLPGLSMSAETAARRILRATRRGKAEVTLSTQAFVLSRLHGLFPGLAADVAGLIDRLLPEPDGIGTQSAKGRDSRSRLSQSFLTVLTRRAAERNNQMP